MKEPRTGFNMHQGACSSLMGTNRARRQGDREPGREPVGHQQTRQGAERQGGNRSRLSGLRSARATGPEGARAGAQGKRTIPRAGDTLEACRKVKPGDEPRGD